MDRSNDTRTDESQGSDHGASSPKLMIQDTDFRIVAEDAPVMLWLTNAEGKVVFTNSRWKKFVGGASGAPLTSDAWVKALHPDDIEPCMKTFNGSFVQHESFQMEYRLRRADGQYRYVLDTASPTSTRKENSPDSSAHLPTSLIAKITKISYVCLN